MLNSYDKNIKFTYEIEKNGQFNFLNVSLINDGEKILTNWYKKDFASNRLINFYSGHKLSTILSTAMVFIHTDIDVSDGSFFLKNRERVINILKDNSWPENEILLIVNKYYTLMKGRKIRIHNDKRYQAIPNITFTSKNIIRNINFLLPENHYMALSSRHTRTNIIHMGKENIPVTERKYQIIIIKCNCRKKTHMCMTKKDNRDSTEIELIGSSFGQKCERKEHSLDILSVKCKSAPQIERKRRDLLELMK